MKRQQPTVRVPEFIEPKGTLLLPQEILDAYEAFIFDMDGTIIDSMTPHYNAWRDVGKYFGYDFDANIMLEMTGTSPYKIALQVMSQAGMDTSRVEEVIDKKREIAYEYNKQAGTLPAFEILKAYKGKKPMAIGTGSSQRFIDLFESKYNLSDYASVIVGGDEVVHHKPDPETFLTCARGLGVQPERCLVFEDGEYGMQAANNGGMDVYNVITHELRRAVHNLKNPQSQSQLESES